ncbi:YihY/virulence factor BrkB family protein [Solimonas sp. SE-A11]|uniref:YihY/virulence factor BrkB family protein n=1 Tax=Solimonas sp. SE-A11 TaxID=3054954 RepID=UPI00259D2A8C|nr:YihY/virulence factor BrkB family protein [Solimonas sp. SE-A11]MDM4770818.1 YihY/virulence factor BrkB family protein [Solimonas sp. SE-A11]
MKQRIQQFLHSLWDLDQVARYPQTLVRAARYVFVLVRDLIDGQLNMRAMGLVYTTLLSIVPLLALAFSMLKALGVHNSLEPVLLEALRPLGSQATVITGNIIGFVEKVNVSVLGFAGVALLFFSVISMIRKVEESFNFIWRIDRPRPLSQRLGEYLAVITVGPLLVVLALGMTGTVMNSSAMAWIVGIEPFGLLIFMLTKLLPYLLIVGLFTFLYAFMPNTRVQLRAAFYGGALAGVLWQTGAAIFASVVIGATSYNAIYSGFAIVILLLIWLYLGWLILLTGCQLAFYVQHPEQIKAHRIPPLLSGKQIEYLSLMVMGMTGRRFLAGEPAYTEEELSLALNAAPEHVARVTDNLIYHGLLIESGADRTRLVPAMDLDSIPVARLWRLARAGNDTMPQNHELLSPAVHELLEGAEQAFERHSQGISLKQWLTRPGN